jgi:hypothetical protein
MLHCASDLDSENSSMTDVSEAHNASLIRAILEAVHTSETSVYFHGTTWRYIPESCYLHCNETSVLKKLLKRILLHEVSCRGAMCLHTSCWLHLVLVRNGQIQYNRYYTVNVTANEVRTVQLQKLITPWRQDPKVHHRVDKSPPPVRVLSELNPHHTTTGSLPKIHSDTFLPSKPRSSEWSLSLRLSQQYLEGLHFSLLTHACHMPTHL